MQVASLSRFGNAEQSSIVHNMGFGLMTISTKTTKSILFPFSAFARKTLVFSANA